MEKSNNDWKGGKKKMEMKIKEVLKEIEDGDNKQCIRSELRGK